LGEASHLEVVCADNAIAQDDAVAEIVKTKEIRSDRKTATLSLTNVGVNSNLHDPSFVVLERPYYPVTTKL
jgi:hypothetical protein